MAFAFTLLSLILTNAAALPLTYQSPVKTRYWIGLVIEQIESEGSRKMSPGIASGRKVYAESEDRNNFG